MKSACPDCMGWREEKTWYKEHKPIKYRQCIDCGGVSDDQETKYPRQRDSDYPRQTSQEVDNKGKEGDK